MNIISSLLELDIAYTAYIHVVEMCLFLLMLACTSTSLGTFFLFPCFCFGFVGFASA